MKPILFNTEMVRALLDGRKTVTRRVIKDAAMGMVYEDDSSARKPPYSPGDVLYVRETFAPLCAEGKRSWLYLPTHDDYCYKATAYKNCLCEKRCCKWHPSIHMPKEAARIFLRVKDVRVERLQNITWRGVLAEGVDNGYANPAMGVRWENAQKMAFSEVWNSTIKPADMDKYGWNANPWVWAIEFERCDKPEEL